MGRVSEHTVGEVARLAGVSVRTLHHYDEVGLLPPSGRSEAGYRLYSPTDLERLRQILFYRELDFARRRCWPRSSTRWRHARWAFR
jgi:DNA-binding transcriptional MerR regulator